MYQSVQGIFNLPDLTHPNELIEFGKQLLQVSIQLAIFLAFLGIVIGFLNFSFRRDGGTPATLISKWLENYSNWLRGSQHLLLILILLVGGFFLCSTLANRYHHWEQARVTQVAASVAGERLEQSAPQVRYVVEEPYSYDTYIDGKIVRVEQMREVSRFMALAGSQIDVKIEQSQDPQKTERTIYSVNFTADYHVINQLNEAKDFFFEVPPPYGYSLLQSFKVERDGNRLKQVNPGDYGFPLRLGAGEETDLRVSYQAQGASRWVYNANGQLLSNFQLNVLANFPKADFASGIVPTVTKAVNNGTEFTWVFDDNVSVQNPFGVFTATVKIRNTGILPRLLLLSPGIFLWWLLLLYLSVPLKLRDVAIAGGVFFACLLTLTYLSRVLESPLAWGAIAPVLLLLVWGLGANRQASLAALICTIAGAVLPILGLLVPYSGLTLSLAGLLSVVWLAVRNWYGWYPLDQNAS